MRRESRRTVSEEGLDFKKVLYISGTILAIAIIGFVITFFVYGNKSNDNMSLGQIDIASYSENTEQTSSQFGKTVNEVENETSSQETTKYAVNTSQVQATSTSSKSKNTQSSQSVQNTENEIAKTEETKDPTFKMPVIGDIIREFAKDSLVYSNTLEEWVTHNGIDIKADKTTVVVASAEGTVKSIKNDPRYGLTVVIEHTNGYTSVYSNLLTAEFVVKGEQVEQGQTIGTVGNTATFEISDEAHLHFEILKDGNNLNPELYIKD